MKIFGVDFWVSTSQMTDDEYVAQIRKSQKDWNSLRWFWPFMAALIVVGIVGWIYFTAQMAKLADDFVGGPDPAVIWWGFAFGATMGFVAGGAVHQAIEVLVQWKRARSRNGLRRERLLLRYYDELQQMKQLRQDVEGS